MKAFLSLLLIIELSFIYTKTITTNNLSSALGDASPGDTIELESGTYSSVPYRLQSGAKDKPITIKAQKGAKVIFTGTNSICIFDFSGVSYASIEGPFELKNALCGVKAMDVDNVKISGLKIHNTQQHGIVISGENNEVSNNEIYDCVMENRNVGKTLEFGWSQCVATWGKNYNAGFSKNIVFKNNYIHEAFGEGLDFLKCDGCSAISNNITNGFSMNIYCDASKNILIDGNILRVNSDDYDTKWGNACGIGLASESENRADIENIVIQNNVIIGTRMGIYFFLIGTGGYDNIKILHNTLWKVSVTPIWFKQPNNKPTNCEMRNNFIYYENQIEFSPKSSWTIGYNYYYNTPEVPTMYEDTEKGSRGAGSLDLSTVFNTKIDSCNYNDRNINAQCLRPSPTPGNWLKLYQSGSKSSITKDFSGCSRSTTNPSIGAFEYPEGCSSESVISDEPIDTDYQVKFRINYCTSGSNTIKMVGEFCSWKVDQGYSLKNEGDCSWSYTVAEPSPSFNYKFVVANGNIAAKWESDPNRAFSLSGLNNAISSSSSGKYEGCDYIKSESLVTLTCNWR